MRYSVVIEKGEKNYSAYLPDVPGCIATGHTQAVTLKRLAKALEMHLAGLREDGLPVPEPTIHRLTILFWRKPVKSV